MTSTRDIIKAKTQSLTLADIKIDLALEEVETAFKNYCNRYDIPDKARFLVANLAVDLLKSQHTGDSDASEPSEGELGSITVDDVSFSFDAAKRAHVINLDDILLNYREQLNQFRKMRW